MWELYESLWVRANQYTMMSLIITKAVNAFFWHTYSDVKCLICALGDSTSQSEASLDSPLQPDTISVPIHRDSRYLSFKMCILSVYVTHILGLAVIILIKLLAGQFGLTLALKRKSIKVAHKGQFSYHGTGWSRGTTVMKCQVLNINKNCPFSWQSAWHLWDNVLPTRRRKPSLF